MSCTNFKLYAEVIMNERLSKIMSGEIHLGFGNQHDGYILETALEVLEADEKKVEEVYENYREVYENGYRLSAMSLASSFASELVSSLFDNMSSAWTD